MSYYWFKRRELFKKVKDRYHISGGNEKVAEYYIANKDVLEVKIIQKLVRKRKKSKKKTQPEQVQKRERKNKSNNFLTNKILIFLYSVKMSKKTLKCDNIKIDKKKFVSLNNQLI